MTSAPIENIQQQDITNIISLATNSKADISSNFSNLMTNAENKVEQTKTKFIDKAVKTNTSSINQFAVKKSATKEDIQTKSSKESNKINQNLSLTNKEKKQNNEIALKSTNKTVNQNEQPSKTNNTNNTVVQTPKNTKQTNVQIQNTNQDNGINQDSLESSPVLLDNDKNNAIELKAQITNDDFDNEDIQKEVKEIVENILITFDIPINQTENNQSIDLETVFDTEQSNNYDFIIKAIDNISSQIDNMDLSQENKDKVFDILNKLKNSIQDIKINFEVDETITGAKRLLDDIVLKLSDNKSQEIKQEVESKPITDNESPAFEDKYDFIENTQKQDETLISSPKEKIENAIKNIKEIAQEVKSAIKDLNEESVKKISDNINKVVLDVKDAVDTVKDEKLIDFDKNLISALKDLSKYIESDNKISIEDTIKKISSLIEDFKIEDIPEDELKIEINSKVNLEKFKIEDTDTLSEIKDKINELQKVNSYEKLTEEDKQKIQDLINKISEIEKNKKEVEPKKIVEVKEEINQILIDTKKTDEIKIDKTSDIVSKNTTQQKIEQTDLRNSQNFKNSNYENKNEVESTKTVLKATKDIEENSEIEDITEKSEINSDEVDNKNQNKPQVKLANLNISEIKDDILDDVEFNTESSSALTVQEEVVKFALNENNSLSSQTPIGNVTYDPANKAITIKNVQNIVQPQYKEVSENNILNQIGDKLYQLKDSQKLTLILRPYDLGRLSIELTSDKNGLTTNIIAQNETVRNYIEKNIHNLRSQLTQAGVNVNSIQIKTAGQDNSATYDGNQNREFQQEQQKQNNQNNQQNRQNQEQLKNEFAQMGNYDFRFAKDFSTVLNKTLSYID